METLLYLVLWGIFIFLMMRFGCGAHVMKQGHGKKQTDGGSDGAETLRWIPPAKDVDPVCGKTVTTQKARTSVFDGKVYYFCSRDCREVFEAAPDIYLRGEGIGGNHLLEQAHV